MMGREDYAFRDQLERLINRILNGDNDEVGLYRALKGSPSWDHFQRAAGRIEALELVLKEMEALAQRMNGEAPVRQQYDRMMN